MSTSKLGRLLIVDDEIELMTALCETLTTQGYETTGLTSAEEALRVLQEQDFDVLLADLMMPAMDGIALLRAGLAIDPHLVGIIMTGQGTVQTAVEAMKVGAFDYVLKPFKLSALHPVLSRAMDMRRLQKENLQLRGTVAMYELSMAIAFTLDSHTILDKVADAALQQCQANKVSILLPTPEGDTLYVAAVRGDRREAILGERIPLDQGIAGWMARHGEPLRLQGEVQAPRFTPLNSTSDSGSVISMPMLMGGKLVGVLTVHATQRRRPFTLGHVKALTVLSSIAAGALEAASLYEALRLAHDQLESQVRVRTAELAKANDDLRSEIVERERVEAALRATNVELESFSYSISHDLRTPLRSIESFAQILLEDYADRLDAIGRDCAQRIAAAARRMDLLTEGLLAYSRLSRAAVDLAPVRLEEVVDDVLTQLEAEIRGKQALVTVERPLPQVMGQYVAVVQVVANLLTNSIKFVAPGVRPQVHIWTEERIEWVRLWVQDNGIGIAPQYQARIFDIFERLHDIESYPGTGIGLAMVRKGMERMGGQVGIESAPGQGSAFWVELRRPAEENRQRKGLWP
jgi:signal transduction histidine kinase/DNA-binding response OmpR family regulator